MRKEVEEIFSQRKIDVIHSAYLVHTLYQQQKLGKYCDLKVLVGDKQYFVHRCILAAASAQLDSQINGLDTIQLVGVTYYGFECLLEILYSGKLRDISSLSDLKFQQIVSAADALNAETVMEYCTRERGDLMKLLLSQSSAISNPQEDQVKQEEESTKPAPDNSHTDSTVSEQYPDIQHVKSESAASNSHDDKEIPDKAEPRSNRSTSEASQLGCSEGPVAAEVEVDGIQKQEEDPLTCSGTGSEPPSNSADGPGVINTQIVVNNEQDLGQNRREYYETDTGMTCRVCGAVFLNSSDLKLHMHTHVGEALFRCEICGLHFPYEAALVAHKKVHNVCKFCRQEFNFLNDLQVHVETMHPELVTASQYAAPEHTLSPQKTSRMSKKKSGVTPSMARSKASGGKPAINPVVVNEIMRGEDGKYQCPLCDRGFDRRWNLKCHVLIHTASQEKDKKPMMEPRYVEATFTCPECGKLFRNLHNLRRHASSVHGMKAADLEERSEGPIGEYTLPTKKPRKEHVEQPLDAYKFWCPICGRGFKRNRNLQGHMEAHQSQGVAKYECPVCHRKFTQKESLNGHLWVHKQGKPEEYH